MSIVSFKISVPTDEGFLGRECNYANCKKYFRVRSDSILDLMHCPYCGTRLPIDELHTKDQIRYLQEAGKEKAMEYAYSEIQKEFDKLASSFKGKNITYSRNPSPYKSKDISASYSERKVDTELTCPDCKLTFQVYGVFGYCPGCNAENMIIYDANISIIRKEISTSDNAQRALRHAYNDLVSTFEHFCSTRANSEKSSSTNFQNISDAKSYFKKTSQVDIFQGISKSDQLAIRRVFQKRHAYQHSKGIITEIYVRKIPEDLKFLGKTAELSGVEFEKSAQIIRIMITNLSEIESNSSFSN